MNHHLLRVLGPTTLLLITAVAMAVEPSPAPMTCGYRTITVEVPGRTPVVTAVWYPADAAETVRVYGSSNRGPVTGKVAFEAPARPGAWPLIIFSHGYSGSGIGQGDVTEALARGGYIVVAPDHSDAVVCARIGTAPTTGTVVEALRYLGAHQIRADGDFAYRVEEIAAVAAGLRIHPELNLDPRRLILAGHSLGGWTVMSAAIAGLKADAMAFYSMGELNWLLKGERIFTSQVFQGLVCPTLYTVGSKEMAAATSKGRDGVYAAFAHFWSPSPSELVVIPDGDHFVYNTPAVAGDAGGSPTQVAAIATATLQFLNRRPGANAVRVLPPGDHTRSVTVGALTRSYILHVPTGYDGTKPMPVVLMFHGGGGTASAAMRETSWTRKADAAGFLAVFPEGLAPDPSKPGKFVGNPQTWNDGSGRFHAGAVDSDDCGFTTAVIDDLATICVVDGRRIYATGFSNGSSMTYRLGAALASRLAAIAPVSSSGLRIAVDHLSRPVPMITLHGTADPLNPIAGGRIRSFGTVENRPPARSSAERWAKMCGCPTTPIERHDREGVTTFIFGPGAEGAEVVMHVIEGMGHTWPGGISLLPESLVGKTTDKLDATDVIWDFFQRHPMPEARTP